MAVTIQNTIFIEAAATASVVSGSITSSGTDRAVVVLGLSAGGSPNSITGVTWNSESLTAAYNSGTLNSFYIPTIYLKAGNASTSATATISASGSNDDNFYAIHTLNNVDQTTPNDTVQITSNGGGSNLSVNCSTAATGDLVLDFFYSESSSSISVGADQTAHVDEDVDNGYAYEAGSSSQAGADGGTMSWTQVGSTETILMGVNMNEAASGVTGTISETLADVTSTFSGTFIALTTGTVSVTLGADTSAISGTFTSPATTGTIAETLDDVTPTISGVVIDLITGSGAITLADVTSAMQGEMGYTGTLAVTLGSDTLAAVGAHASVIGTIANTLEDTTSSITGEVRWTGSIGVVLDDVTLTASATFTSGTIEGTIAVTLDGVTVTASGIGGDVVERQFIDDVVTELVINLIEEEVN